MAIQILFVMRKLSIVLVIAATICAGMLSACSDEPVLSKTDSSNFVKKGEVTQGKIDINTLSRFTTDLKDATYTLEDFAVYNMDDYSNGLWEELDTRTLDGWSLPMSRTIVVKDGISWEPIITFTSHSGPSCFGIALDLIERVEGKDYSVFIKKAINIDVEKLTVSIGNREYGILLADGAAMVLSYEYPYYGGRTHNGGLEMCVASYSLSEPLEFDDTAMAYDSETEAYDWLIDVFGKTFGDSVNLNDYYNGAIILTNPMFYLSDLIAERDRLSGR